jgi:DNA repair protein RadC
VGKGKRMATENKTEETPQDDSAGHKKRLREKFLKSGLSGFADYEIVEMLLGLGRRDDTKPQAKEAMKKFKTLRGVLEAPVKELQQINGIGPSSAFNIKMVQEVGRKFLQEKLVEKPAFKSSKEIFEYLYHSMRDLRKEVFKVIYLNSQNQIIGTEDLSFGTVNASMVSPREIIEGAIRHNAVSLIFAHNHPSGNPDPSQSDKEVTRDLVFAASIMSIKVLDHIIIGDNKFFSFTMSGLIEQAELGFLNLRMKGVPGGDVQSLGANRSPFQ